MLPLDDVLTWEGIRSLAATHVLRDFPTGGLSFCEPGTGAKAWKLPSGRGLRQMGRPQPAFDTRHQIVSTRDAWWAPWREKVKQLPGPFVLVSTFHDSQIGDLAVKEMFADGSPVSAWFGVQVATNDPRVTKLPLGVKGETVAHMRGVPRLSKTERDIPLYLNFQRRTQERADLWDTFPWAVREYTPNDPAAYLQSLGRARFVLSPPGRSWDCYRTYEAIAMGAVPIVKRQAPMSDVVEGMPVLMVDDWAEVTPARLAYEYPRMTGSTERLTLSHWREQITHAAQAAQERAWLAQ